MSCTSDGGHPGDAGRPYLSRPQGPQLAPRLRNRSARAQAAAPRQARQGRGRCRTPASGLAQRTAAPGRGRREAEAEPTPALRPRPRLRRSSRCDRQGRGWQPGAPGGVCAAPSPAAHPAAGGDSAAPRRLRAPAAAPPPRHSGEGTARPRRGGAATAAARRQRHAPSLPHCGTGEGVAAPHPLAPAPTRTSAVAAIFGEPHNGQDTTPDPARTPPARMGGGPAVSRPRTWHVS